MQYAHVPARGKEQRKLFLAGKSDPLPRSVSNFGSGPRKREAANTARNGTVLILQQSLGGEGVSKEM